MNNISKVSQITTNDLADYMRLIEVDQNDQNTLNTLLTVSKSFIMQYTGRTEAELDDYQDFVIAVFVLVQDMWDNRTLYVDKGSVSMVVQSILDLHSVNLL